ncbi:hypothetical protein ABID70_002650 [Clavibacter michiganensis]
MRRAHAEHDVEPVRRRPRAGVGADELQAPGEPFALGLLAHAVEARVGVIHPDRGERRLAPQGAQQPAAVAAPEVEDRALPGDRDGEEAIDAVVAEG